MHLDIQKCPLCGDSCTAGHFHALEDPQALHLCGKAHRCGRYLDNKFVPNECEHEGACVIEGEIETVKRQFHGLHDTFEYDHVTKQGMKHHFCDVEIPPGQLNHDGPHTCNRPADQHYCGEKCPCCGYRCVLTLHRLLCEF